MADQNYLIIDDDETFSSILARSLRRRQLIVNTAADEPSALATCQLFHPRRVILDLKLEKSSGLNLITKILEIVPECRIVVLTGYSSIPTTVDAIKLGATHYLCKPAAVEDILAAFSQRQGNAETAIASSPHSVERLEWEHIQRVLSENSGNISATARALGMHRRTLQRKLQKRPVKA